MLHVRVNLPPVIEAIEALAEGLVLLNLWYMEQASDNGVDLPPLYESGIVYRREPAGQEWWETAADLVDVVAGRSGDCEDLANIRAAELRFTGEDPEAYTHVVRTRRGTFHAIVGRGDGSYEDPSRICIELERERTGRDPRRAGRGAVYQET